MWILLEEYFVGLTQREIQDLDNTCFVLSDRQITKGGKLYSDEGRRGCDRMVVGFTTAYAISAYHH
jgi:hypothetical protein